MKSSNIRWMITALIFFATSINYLDRAVLGVAGPAMMGDLGLDKVQFGVLASAFFWSYALMQIPVGMIVDKLGARMVYAVAIVWWSVCTILTGIVRGFALLIGVRALMGVGESPAFPTNTRVIADWLPARERGIANGLFTMGIAVGAGLTTPAVAWVISTYSWEMAFYITGVLGIVWAGLWFFLFRNDPKTHPNINQAELEHIRSDQGDAEPVKSNVRWYHMLRSRNVWCILYGLFAMDYLLYMVLSWLPTYLVEERGMALLNAGFYAIMPWIAASVGALAGGYLSDTLIRRGLTPIHARRNIMASGLILALAIIPAAYVQSSLMAVSLISLALGGNMFANGAAWAVVADIAPTGSSGTLAGMQNFIGNISGWIAPILTGFLAQTLGSFSMALIIAGVISGLAALGYIFLLKDRNEFGTEYVNPATA